MSIGRQVFRPATRTVRAPAQAPREGTPEHPFLEPIDLINYEPDQDIINQALWGHSGIPTLKPPKHPKKGK